MEELALEIIELQDELEKSKKIIKLQIWNVIWKRKK